MLEIIFKQLCWKSANLSVSVICQFKLVNQFWWISIWMERSASVSVSSVQYDNISFVTLITDAMKWGRIIASAPSELCVCLKHLDCRLLVSVHHNLVHAQLTIRVKELYWLNKLMLTLMINSNTPFPEILVVICNFLSEWSSMGQFGVLTSVLLWNGASLIGRSDSFPFTYGNFSLGTHRRTRWHTCTTPTVPGGQLPNEGNAWQVRARLWLLIRLCLPSNLHPLVNFHRWRSFSRCRKGSYTQTVDSDLWHYGKFCFHSRFILWTV